MEMNSIRALLFDVDGTLYPLRPIRMAALRELVLSHVMHVTTGVRTIRALAAYRRSQELLRRKGLSSPALRDAQIQTASELCNLPCEFIARCVSYWMEEQPLTILPRYVREDLIALLRYAKQTGRRTAVCSDYAAAPKIAALKLTEWIDVIVSAHDSEIGEFKPSPKMLNVALNRLDVLPEQALYLGDRPEIDGVAAKRAGVAFLAIRGRRNIDELIGDTARQGDAARRRNSQPVLRVKRIAR